MFFRKVLIDFSIFCSFDGNDLLTSFADDKDGDSSVLDFTLHYLRYDDIVHKEDSVGYRVFLTTGLFVSPPPSPLIIQHFFTCCFNLFFYLTGLFFSLCPLWFKLYILGSGNIRSEHLHVRWSNRYRRFQDVVAVPGIRNWALWGHIEGKVG